MAVSVHEVVDPLDPDRTSHRASMVNDGAWWATRPRFEAAVTAPYPHTVVSGIPFGRTCCENCLIEIS